MIFFNLIIYTLFCDASENYDFSDELGAGSVKHAHVRKICKDKKLSAKSYSE